jgi:hypothetical protein
MAHVRKWPNQALLTKSHWRYMLFDDTDQRNPGRVQSHSGKSAT